MQKYVNGDEFSGDFKDGGRKNGVMKFKGGEKYSGEWKEGLFHGSGSLSYDTGLKY